MKNTMPQEIEVWYLIPALRREIAKILIKDYNITQKNASDILNLTEASISQYLNSKRANKMKFSKKENEEIKKAADKIINDKKEVIKQIYGLCVKFRKSKAICNVHKKYSSSVPENCSVCFGKNR